MSDKSLENFTDQLISEAGKLSLEQQHAFVRPFHLLQAIVEREDARAFFESFNFPFDKLEDKVKRSDPGYTEYPTAKKWSVTSDVHELCRSAERHALDNGRSGAGLVEVLFMLQEMGDEATTKTIKKLKLEDNYFQAVLNHDVSKYNPLTGVIGEGVVDIGNIEKEPNEISRETALAFGDTLKDRVFSQDNAIDAITKGVKRKAAGLNDDESTIGNYLFIGPTGVGKTEVAKQAADALDCKMVRIDMSELGDKHSSGKLIGTTPGYIGFDEGGILTNAVIEANNKDEFLVLLLDEVEKAHDDVFNVLLQVMDDARLTDGHGKRADFRNVLIIMTSNIGAQEAEAAAEAKAVEATKLPIGFGTSTPTAEEFNDNAAESIPMQAVKAKFKPEFRNRLTATIEFNPLDQEVMHRIAQKFVDLMNGLPASNKSNLTFTVSQNALDKLAIDGYDPKMGARPLKRLIESEFKDRLTDLILEEQISDENVELDFDDKSGEFKLEQKALDTDGPKLLPSPANDDAPEAPEGSIVEQHVG